MIQERLTVGPFAVNCYIIGDESTKEGMIVDAGDEPERILRTVEKLGLTIPLMVNTHCHADHVGALASVQRATKAKFALHEAELPILKHAVSTSMMLTGMPIEEPPQPEILLKDGDEVTVGGLTFSVIHTPG